MVERVDGLTIGKGERRTDLEDGKAHVCQTGKCTAALIVCAVGFEHYIPERVKRCTQGGAVLLWQVVDVEGGELHARLHDEAADPLFRGVEAQRTESIKVHVQGPDGSFGRGWFNGVLLDKVTCAAGGRDFCADDVVEAAWVGSVFFADGCKLRGAASTEFISNLSLFSSTSFGAVQMDFGEACLHVAFISSRALAMA